MYSDTCHSGRLSRYSISISKIACRRWTCTVLGRLDGGVESITHDCGTQAPVPQLPAAVPLVHLLKLSGHSRKASTTRSAGRLCLHGADKRPPSLVRLGRSFATSTQEITTLVHTYSRCFAGFDGPAYYILFTHALVLLECDVRARALWSFRHSRPDTGRWVETASSGGEGDGLRGLVVDNKLF